MTSKRDYVRLVVQSSMTHREMIEHVKLVCEMTTQAARTYIYDARLAVKQEG